MRHHYAEISHRRTCDPLKGLAASQTRADPVSGFTCAASSLWASVPGSGIGGMSLWPGLEDTTKWVADAVQKFMVYIGIRLCICQIFECMGSNPFDESHAKSLQAPIPKAPRPRPEAGPYLPCLNRTKKIGSVSRRLEEGAGNSRSFDLPTLQVGISPSCPATSRLTASSRTPGHGRALPEPEKTRCLACSLRPALSILQTKLTKL